MRPPERIYLQIDPTSDNADYEEAVWDEQVTWCAERIGASDVEYVIAPREKRLKRWRDAEQAKEKA
jgi:hypothetical protein